MDRRRVKIKGLIFRLLISRWDQNSNEKEKRNKKKKLKRNERKLLKPSVSVNGWTRVSFFPIKFVRSRWWGCSLGRSGRRGVGRGEVNMWIEDGSRAKYSVGGWQSSKTKRRIVTSTNKACSNYSPLWSFPASSRISSANVAVALFSSYGKWSR